MAHQWGVVYPKGPLRRPLTPGVRHSGHRPLSYPVRFDGPTPQGVARLTSRGRKGPHHMLVGRTRASQPPGRCAWSCVQVFYSTKFGPPERGSKRLAHGQDHEEDSRARARRCRGAVPPVASPRPHRPCGSSQPHIPVAGQAPPDLPPVRQPNCDGRGPRRETPPLPRPRTIWNEEPWPLARRRGVQGTSDFFPPGPGLVVLRSVGSFRNRHTHTHTHTNKHTHTHRRTNVSMPSVRCFTLVMHGDTNPR